MRRNDSCAFVYICQDRNNRVFRESYQKGRNIFGTKLFEYLIGKRKHLTFYGQAIDQLVQQNQIVIKARYPLNQFKFLRHFPTFRDYVLQILNETK
jgi:hypothetical protein